MKPELSSQKSSIILKQSFKNYSQTQAWKQFAKLETNLESVFFSSSDTEAASSGGRGEQEKEDQVPNSSFQDENPERKSKISLSALACNGEAQALCPK